MFYFACLLLCFLSLSSALKPEETSTPREDMANYILQNHIYPGVRNMSAALDLVDILLKVNPADYDYESNVAAPAAFPCNTNNKSPSPPTNARRLLPGDIDVVMAAGDSLTAGFGALARTIFDLFGDWRGASWSIGDQNSITTDGTTLGNIFRLYNPNSKGQSSGKGNQNSAGAHLNVAVTGAETYEVPPQIDALITRLQSGAYGNFQTSWKVLTIFIGSNDLCNYCKDKSFYSPQNFAANMAKILDKVKTIPRVFVNIISPVDVTILGRITAGLCSLLHGYECPCNKDATTSQAHKDYFQALLNLEKTYPQTEDFVVKVQPFLVDLEPPKKPDGNPDMSYFAPDCFHWSGKAHLAGGLALWNNMLEANKQTTWIPGEPFECPTPNQPYLQ